MKQFVIDTLNDGFTTTIKFDLSGTKGFPIKIDIGDFQLVSRAIETGSINVEQGGGVPAGMAKYTAQDDGASKANTMYVGANSASEKVFKSLIVHEAIHAIFDLKRISLPWLDNEVTAYIAQGFYLQKAGFKTGQKEGLSPHAFLGLHVAQEFETIEEDKFWLENLQDSLVNDPDYSGYIHKEFRGDG